MIPCTWDLGWPRQLGPLCWRPAEWENTVPGDPFTVLVAHLPPTLCHEHYLHPNVTEQDRAVLRRIE